MVLLLAFAGSAEAGFFLNDDQEGMRAFERQEFERAAASFRDPAWKASSYYRAGNFEEALQHFAMPKAFITGATRWPKAAK